MGGKIKMKTIPQVSDDTLKLQAFIEKQKEGTELSFNNIQSKTGIRMDEKGKSYLKTALKRSKMEYSSIRGYGIKIAETSDVMPILTNKLVKIDKAVRRGEKCQKNLQEKFFDSLDQQTQKQILFVGAVFGAVRVAAENGRVVYSKAKQIDSKARIDI